MPGRIFLEGEKVQLRNIEKEDAGFLRDGVNHPDVRKHTVNWLPQTLEDEEEFIQHITESEDEIHLLICKNNQPMGIVSLAEKEGQSNIAKTGIWLHPDFHGKGYGSEASEIIVEHGFNQLNYHKIFARTHSDNKPSQKIWEKLGFKEEGRLREHIYTQGEHKDVIYYGLLQGERE